MRGKIWVEGNLIIAQSEKGGTHIARIIGIDPDFGFKREMIGEREIIDRKTEKSIIRIDDLNQPYDFIEVRAGGKKSVYRHFYFYDASKNKLTRLTESQLKEKIEKILLKEA